MSQGQGTTRSATRPSKTKSPEPPLPGDYCSIPPVALAVAVAVPVDCCLYIFVALIVIGVQPINEAKDAVSVVSSAVVADSFGFSGVDIANGVQCSFRPDYWCVVVRIYVDAGGPCHHLDVAFCCLRPGFVIPS